MHISNIERLPIHWGFIQVFCNMPKFDKFLHNVISGGIVRKMRSSMNLFLFALVLAYNQFVCVHLASVLFIAKNEQLNF